MTQILGALAHIHTSKVIHLDLKPENLLLDNDGYLRVADFGLSWKTVKANTAANRCRNIQRSKTVNLDNPISKQFDRKNILKRVCGTAEYIAPEILTQKGYGKEVDLWALGILVLEMLTGRPPFFSNDKKEQMEMIMTLEPKYPHYLSRESKDFIKKLLIKDPKHRLGSFCFDEIKNHVWFKEVDWDLLYNKGYEAPFKPTVKDEFDLSHFDAQFTGLYLDTFYLSQEKKPSSIKFRGFYFDDLSERTTQEDLDSGMVHSLADIE